MLTIRANQMGTMAIGPFEDRMLPHLQEFFPRHHAVLGEDPLRQVIRLGVPKAQSYGLDSESNIRTYIDLMCLLGSGFDCDPQVPWAARILNDRTETETGRTKQLHARTLDYVNHVMPDYRRLVASSPKAPGIEELQRLRQESSQPVAASAYPQFVTRVLLRLQQIFPAKCEYLGSDVVLKTINHAMAAGETHGINIERGFLLYGTITFIVGAGFESDPQVPWAGEVLKDPSLKEPLRKVDRLYAEAVSFLNRWFA